MSSADTTLKHYFVSHEQQFDAAKLGMWLFLVTEVLLFSGMFVAYAVYRSWHPEVFLQASELLDWRLGALNTVVLLASSFTVALAIHFVQKGQNDKVIGFLILTLACAAVFMIVKYFEYEGKFSHGVFPGAGFEPHGMVDGKDYSKYDIPFAPQFFSIYFVMTGIHGVHVLVGMGLFGWLTTRVARGHFSPQYYTPVELTGLYWHLVDIIWIFLFPLLYLI
ncbi:MAG: cytochrome c oxidase subunit 3 family protein [Bacteroidota bacterium]|nr:cytochrome c oxidase subunit 3 family protein [Bacteroidota bacterium]MXW14489.1 cytochrome c oxidase subunit 3 family protein [Rhodothermaceae bacterium]MDE2645760.1 cytochrome c oxidase subunit 3 family protein [Bacteroidota bacterium]MXW32022.1 cytochrome c oxidase subunit 3 family protein [Rhodothermaceae bacterium]MXZ16878.1 cytochrome c oxidase subunit 3 family protein [Rhodothermaceae bacterium]